MFFRPGRGAANRDHLEGRVALFVAGAALGLAGILLQERLLTGAAIAVLAAGALAGLKGRRRPPDREGEPPTA